MRRRAEDAEDWEIDTLEGADEEDTDTRSAARLRMAAVRLGYTQTEAGYRHPWKIATEWKVYMEAIGRTRKKEYDEIL